MTEAGTRASGWAGRIGLDKWIDLSLEGERTTQGGSVEHEVALHGSVWW